MLHSSLKSFAFANAVWIASCLVGWPLSAAFADEAPEIGVMNALLKTIEATSLAAEVAGKIEQLDAVEGTHVQAGKKIGKIRDQAVQLRLENARISLAIARKKRNSDVNLRLAKHKSEVANNELERAEASNSRLPNTYSPKEIDRLRLVARSAILEIERAQEDQELAALDVLIAENEFRQASELLSLHQIESPVDGVVVSVGHRVGEWVEPGTELLQIVKNDRLRIEGFVSAEAASQDLVGRKAAVTVVSGNSEWKVDGKVIFVSPDANPVNGNVRVFLEIDNREGKLRPGMRVIASIENSNP